MISRAAALIAMLAAVAAGPVLGAPPPPLLLGGKALQVPLSSPIATRTVPRHCVVTVEGRTADHPAGTTYELLIAVPGTAPFSAGAISFYDAIGLPPGASDTLSFEIPRRYCTAKVVVATLRPAGAPNPAAKARIGRIVLKTK